MLALLTPGSYGSEICRAEQMRSLRKGKCVIPVLAAACEIPLYFETKNYRDFRGEGAYRASYGLLLGDIEGRNGAGLAARYRTTYVSVPPMVANYIERPEAVRALRDALFAGDGHRAVALTAVAGMGGIGKTVLAQALFQDEVVRAAFPDGLVWITVGREATRDVGARLREIVRMVGGASDEAVAAETLYRTTMASKAALIVVDDIWSKADLDPFLAESARSRFLFTTRDESIGRFSGAREHRADVLGMLRRGSCWRFGRAWRSFRRRRRMCFASAAGCLWLCHGGRDVARAAPAEWGDTAGLLAQCGSGRDRRTASAGAGEFFRAIDVSVKALEPKMQERYGKLAVLLEDMAGALPVLETLWNRGEAEARRIGRRLVDRSLAQSDGEGGIRLHDLQLDYVRARYGDREALEVDPWGGAVVGARDREGCATVRFADGGAAVGVSGCCGDSAVPRRDRGRGSEALVAAAAIPRFILQARPLLRTLEGHSDCVYGVAVTPDGKRAVSASQDHTLKVWDLETGRALRTLEGHSAAVRGVAVTPDGKRAVSASGDKTLKVWDLETGRALRTLEGHSDSVNGVAVTPDGKRAVSASADNTLKVWDLETGRALRTLEGHSASVHGVAVTPDGKRAVSASGDKTLKVWDLETGRALRTLEGHSDSVDGVAVTPDGKRAVSASWDNTLKVWDLETGRALRTLEGHSAYVYGVAVTADGKRAVSASRDKTLKVWDLETGRALHTLEGHSASVYGVAVTPDGKRAVSASGDKTLKVWEPGHRQRVAHAWKATLARVYGRGGDAGQEAGGVRVFGPQAERVGPGDRPRTTHPGRPL